VLEIRLRNKISKDELEEKKGKILTEEDHNVTLTQPTAVYKPDGKLLCKYLPATFAADWLDGFYNVLSSLKAYQTDNRGLAGGSGRTNSWDSEALKPTRTRGVPVSSAIIGAFDAKPPFQYCRLTAWTGKENEQFRSLYPLFQAIGARFAEEVPDRFAAQMKQVARTPEEWVIEGTPFSTITVNNTYPTGVHTDKGDLDEGFSTLTVLRRGSYRGALLTFPEYRVAVDMQDGDLLLMDAHEWHGNTAMFLDDPECDMCDERATAELTFERAGKATRLTRPYCLRHAEVINASKGVTVHRAQEVVPAERISVVSYYRTKIANCGPAEVEAQRAVDWGERRIAIGDEKEKLVREGHEPMVAKGMANAAVNEMAAESLG
jgi:hypothetical protein